MTTTRIRRARRHLMSWGTGRGDLVPAGAAGTATVVLESAEHLDAVLASDLVGPRTLVFVPEAQGTGEPGGQQVIGYHGSATEPGGDLAIDDDFYLQIQDYATCEYMSVLGATMVRILDGADFEAFLADADAALADGRFPTFLVEPAVQLADVAALGGPDRGDGPRTRLHVDPRGRVSTAPGGLPLGSIGDPVARLAQAWARRNGASAAPDAVALGSAVPEVLRCAAVAHRPWLGRYLAALEAVRELAARGVADVRVSGFGGRLGSTCSGDGPDLYDAALPLLAWTEDAAYLRCTASGRTFALDADAAGPVEALLVRGSAADTADAEIVAAFAATGVTLLADHGEPPRVGAAS